MLKTLSKVCEKLEVQFKSLCLHFARITEMVTVILHSSFSSVRYFYRKVVYHNQHLKLCEFWCLKIIWVGIT